MWLLEHPPRGRFMPRRSSILEAAAARTKSRSCRRTRRKGRHNRARASMNSNSFFSKKTFNIAWALINLYSGLTEMAQGLANVQKPNTTQFTTSNLPAVIGA